VNLHRFALAYAILIFFLAASTAASIKILTSPAPATKAQVKKVENAVSPSDALIIQTACAYIGQAAAQEGLISKSCDKVDLKLDGNQALVTLRQVTNQGTYTVKVHLQRAGWNPDGLQVQ